MRDQALNPPISPEGGGCKACIVVQKVSLLVELLFNGEGRTSDVLPLYIG